jgi:hypothetical protein
VWSRARKRSTEARLPFSQQTRESGYQPFDGGVKVWLNCTAMNVAPRQRETRASREAFCCSTVAAQNNVRGDRVVGKTLYRGDFLTHELTQSVAEPEVMCGEVNRKVSHWVVPLLFG